MYSTVFDKYISHDFDFTIAEIAPFLITVHYFLMILLFALPIIIKQHPDLNKSKRDRTKNTDFIIFSRDTSLTTFFVCYGDHFNLTFNVRLLYTFWRPTANKLMYTFKKKKNSFVLWSDFFYLAVALLHRRSYNTDTVCWAFERWYYDIMTLPPLSDSL